MYNIYGDGQHEKVALRTRTIEQAVLIPTMNFFDDPEQFGLQDRQGQGIMSIDIAEALSKEHHIMVEAGAGIGKSLAYLIPALFAMKKFNKSVVIAVTSNALAEQLVGDAQQAKLLTGILTPDVILGKRPVISMDGEARIIIMNQELLIRQLLLKPSPGQGFNKDNTIFFIIDEAHHLEENTRSALTTKWTLQGLKSMERALQQALPKDSTRKEHIENLRKVGEYRSQFVSKAIDHMQDLETSLSKHQDARRVWLPNKHVVNYTEWAKELEKVIQACSPSLSEETLELPKFIRRLWQYANSSYLVWLEKNPADPCNFSICTAPKNINNELEKLLFSKSIPVVLTSDTLCNAQGSKQEMYRYYAESIGFPEDNSEFSDLQPSTFNYEEKGLLYIPNDLPRPDNGSNREVYLIAIADRIAELIAICKGKTLVLFTAKADMQDVHTLLIKKTWLVSSLSCPYLASESIILSDAARKGLPYSLLLGGGKASQQMIDQFAESKGVLLATGDYWEEARIPDSTLSSLIIVQLPFPAFDPIIDYKISQVVDPIEILLPEMLTKLRQGVGRLIRTRADAGVLSILDARISDSCKLAYKEEVLRALPIRNLVGSLLEVEAFQAKI